MKMKKLLSIGALALTITTCTSMSAFAAESMGNREEAAKKIATNIWKEKKVVKDLNIDATTPVKKYAKPALVNKIKECVGEGISNQSVKQKLYDAIDNGYNKGDGIKEIFEEVVAINKQNDITTNTSFEAAKNYLNTMLEEFETASDKGTLSTTVNKYFYVSALNGTLYYGMNSNGKTTVSLMKAGKVVLQVSSENIYSLKSEIDSRVNSWSDLKDYFNAVK